MDTDHSSAEVAVTVPDSPIIARFDAFPLLGDYASMDYQVFTSLDLSDPAEGQIFYDGMTVGGADPKTAINHVLDLVHMSCWPITFVHEETGEEVKTWSVVLVPATGPSIQFKSAGILKSLATLMMVRGRPPWRPAVKMKLILRALGGGRQMYMLERAGDWGALPAAKAKK